MTARAPTTGATVRSGPPLRRLAALPPSLVALADQAAVSGFGFLVGIGSARILGIEAFGHFALVLLLTAFAQGVHNALVTAPMMTLAGSRGRVTAAYGASLVAGTLLLALPCAAIVAMGLLASGTASPGVLAGAAALVLAQNLQVTLRRLLFANGAGPRAFAMDAARAVACAAAVALAAVAKVPVGPAGLLWLLAASAVLTGLLAAPPGSLRPGGRVRLRGLALRHWPIARWLLPVVFVTFAQEQAIWIAAGIALGPEALGGLRAAQVLVGIVLLLQAATENTVPVAAARAYARGGTAALDQYLASVGRRFGAPILVLLAVLAIPAASWLGLVFGAGFAAYAPCLQVLALGAGMIFVRDLAAHHFRARHETGIVFRSQVVGLAASVGAGISMGLAEALSDDGAVTGRGNPIARGAVTGVATTLGGMLHTLPFLLPDLRTALYSAYAVVVLELLAIAYIRFHFMKSPLGKTILQVIVGGGIVFAIGVWLGRLG